MKQFKALKPGRKVQLDKIDPDSHTGLADKSAVERKTEMLTREIGALQEALYADSTQALLIVLQGMDTAGKDGVIRCVFDHVNPAGMHVHSFKTPSVDEKRHDFLWRIHQQLPPYGHIGIFNRSHYEDVLVVRVHAAQMLPEPLRRDKKLFTRRFEMINDFEWGLAQARVRIIKFFLHISRDEQRQRLEARQRDRKKHWKLSESDFTERAFWREYQNCYTEMLSGTNSDAAPWYVVPANHKWVRNHVIAQVVRDTLTAMNPQPPKLADKSLVTRKFSI